MSDATKYINKLKDKNVLIIGGSSGIGFGVAEASLEHGARVIISSSNQARVDNAISRLISAYPSAKTRVSGHALDMGDQATLETNVVSLLDKSTASGKLDHIVWTAGGALAVMSLPEITTEKLAEAGTVRFFGPVMLAKHAAQYLNPGPASSIVLTTGLVYQKPISGWAAPGGFAGALHSLNLGLALDLKPLRVNLVSPGAVVTELWDGWSEEIRTQMLKQFAEKSTTGVVGRVEDVAEAYIYLMKDHNITGTVISTNSGALLV